MVLRIKTAVKRRLALRSENLRISDLAREISRRVPPPAEQAPVVFFNASTRLFGLSLNAAFSLLSSWGLQMAGAPVVHFVCHSGMSRCVLGTNKDNHLQAPPCEACISQSRVLFPNAPVEWLNHPEAAGLEGALRGSSMAALETFEAGGVPLGSLTLPSLRWALRRHHLPENEAPRSLFKEYILSADRMHRAVSACFDRLQPSALVVFNGMMYPEAIARWVAQKHGIRVITHEVGFQPHSAFFTEGQATAYPLDIPPGFQLNAEQNNRLDAHLERRMHGKFSMAGIQFWPEIQGLGEAFDRRAENFASTVAVFTNVVFDTSQVHANTIFPHMFAWLDLVLEVIRANPNIFFVIRAHPDEMRAGKESRESVEDWVRTNGVDELANVQFIGPMDYISSYELIQRSKFVMVYNSSIGLEAALMGAAVVSGGEARYTRYPIAYSPESAQAYQNMITSFLNSEAVGPPAEAREQARRLLYHQFFRASLPFDAYIEPGFQPGFVRLRQFDPKQLQPEHSATIETVVNGVLHGQPFLLDA